MKNPSLVSVKLTDETRRMLKTLAGLLNKHIYEIAEKLARAEFKKRGLK